GYLKFHQEAGCGIYLYAPCLYQQSFDESVKVESKQEGLVGVTTITTPVGTVRSLQQRLPGSGTSAYVEHFVKKPEDLKVMRYFFNHRHFQPAYVEFEKIDNLWNGWGIPCATAPCCTSTLQTLLTRWAGVTTTIELLQIARGEVELTIEEVQASDEPIFEILAASPALLFCLPENLSGQITGRFLMEKYELAYWEKRVSQLHRTGKYVILHNDGTLRASLPLLLTTSLDGIEAVTPEPAGDMTLEEIEQMVSGKKVIWGGLPGVFFSPRYSEEFFVAYVKQVLKTFPRGWPFVLGVADQVPPDAEWSRIRLVRDLVEEYG
ncbi:MAG TPA: hypothetical protein PK644_00705, partial [bacterium]|nr:hypothetical protein [bacterium]